MTKRNRNATPSQITAYLVIATGAYVSDTTILLRLNQVGVYAQKPARASRFNHVIDKKDHIGVWNILIGVTNSDPECCSLMSPISL